MTFAVKQSSGAPRFATAQLTLDPFTGAILRKESYADYNSGRKARTWMRFLHTGEALGFFGKLVAAICAAPAIVLGPLGMKNSTFRQPLPAALQGQMSQGYLSQDEPPKGFEIISMPPAGSLSASGSDMGRFMIAYLQQGRLGDAQILKPETVRLMHGQLTRQLPGLSGIGLGFYEQNVNGHRVLAHGGDTVLFHSDLLLFVANTVNLGADLAAMGEAARLMTGRGDAHLYTLAFAAFSLWAIVFVPYHRYVGLLKWLTLSLLTGAAKPDLLQIITTDSGPIISRASAKLAAAFRNSWVDTSEDDAGVLARAIVRLAMSYVSMPPESDHDVADDLARLMTPFAERYGVIQTGRN